MENRIKKIKNILREEKLDGILVSSVPTIFYLTGFAHFSTEEREAFLLLTKTRNYIITDARYSESIRQNVPHCELLEISARSGLSTLLKETAKKHSLIHMGFEAEDIRVAEHVALRKCFKKLKPVNLSTLRLIKEPIEVKSVQKACALGDDTFKYILPFVKKGVSEKELATLIELYIKKRGHDISFKPIVAFGRNAAIPHHGSSEEKLKLNNFVLLDFGVKVNGYCSDMTRTIFFGKPTTEQKRMYEVVLESQKRAIEFLNQGIKAADVDKEARSYIESQGYPSIPHSLGHGTGVEVHEAPHLSPRSSEKLENGMVFSIEPGIYVSGFGGVRIEDLVVLEHSVPRLLTKSPKDLIEI